MLSRVLRFSRFGLRKNLRTERCFSSEDSSSEELPWKNPWKHALSQREETLTGFEEVAVDWKYVDRLMPHRVIPDVPEHASYPTPSGWMPPNPSPDLPYYVARRRNHMLPLFLENRRDKLDPKTMEFDYVDLVVLRNVHGDVFACERDLRAFLERQLNHPVATNVDELKGIIRVKGADRTLVEKFLFDCGF
uniref:Large ribosomal subunit protein mL49 n=1 Tax=Parascaris univalens TaxID=6257 RepID=A0A915C3S6_PARUN